MHLKILKKKVMWSFVDAEGRVVKDKYVDYNPGVSEAMTDLKDQLVQKYDKHELERVRDYNMECMVNLVRRRITRFSKAGTEEPPHVDCRDHPVQLVRVTLAADVLRFMSYLDGSEGTSESGED
ncbi:hypothetical protein CEP54_013839 [Fusarium duplospermum]|uniref:Uncharacterized protein n=1 Tax=Fusarium duplospermum TaxID=1325734 RepID=A0A428P006_9HYPO|nr:hypothetical protein CEP54_013839 [Fusarium duplospermum]